MWTTLLPTTDTASNSSSNYRTTFIKLNADPHKKTASRHFLYPAEEGNNALALKNPYPVEQAVAPATD